MDLASKQYLENLSVIKMDTKSIVPRLENLAYTASFKEILSNLALCHDHRSSNEQKTFNYSSFMSTMATSEKLISFVRNRLDYHLVGFMSDKMREKYVKQFYETLCQLKENTIEPWVFLDSVLDESFQELEIHAALPGAEPNSRLISTIAESSSELKKLKIDFSLMKNPIEVVKISPLITSLSSLKNLTSLSLNQMRESHRSVLKLIGNSCPLLTHLRVSGFCFTANDYFSLFFGDFSDQLFPEQYGHSKDWSVEFPSSLEFLQAPSEILTPICFTLRHLQLSFGSDMYREKFYSLAAFILRHLPSLEKMDGHHTSFGVEKLQYSTSSPNEAKKRKLNHEVEAKKFENACKELASLRHPGIVLINHSTFSGTLSLVSLDYVYLNSDMFQSIPKFCPQLKQVKFLMPSSQIRLDDGGSSADVSPPRELQEHFKNWPRLETITLVNIPPEYAKIILEAFASSLKSVTFSSCSKIILMDLISCFKLESLSIIGFSILDTPEIEPGRPPPNFLPQLKSFQSDYCLGLWSLWLEQKSDLSCVTLNCCHYGTKASAYPHCCSIPKIWSNLETLKLRRCPGLTVSMLSNFVRQLPKLKELSLPETVAKNDPKLAAKIWEDIHYQPSPVHLYFTNDHVYQRCPFVPVVPVVLAVEVTSSEDSNIEESDSNIEESDSNIEESDSNIEEMANSDSDDSF